MGTLPDDVLLVVFKSCLDEYSYEDDEIGREEAWRSLVQVCRQWRTIVFESPRQLNLQLVCVARTPARDTLDVWPVFPLAIRCQGLFPIRNMDDIIAVLERRDRVRRIDLVNNPTLNLEILFAAMQQSFPELVHLRLWPHIGTVMVPVVPDSFLGGIAPRLESLQLDRISFPGLPKLLLSATHLVRLSLHHIPHFGYISPDAMATALSTLTSLETLRLEFESDLSLPDPETRHLLPSTRTVLPVLTFFRFKGVSIYLDDFVVRIDTPRLTKLSMTFLDDVVFDTPQLIQFIGRTSFWGALEKAHIVFLDNASYVKFLSQTSRLGSLKVDILCSSGLEWQFSSMEQVCISCLPPLSMSEDLYIYRRQRWRLDGKEHIENELWLQLLHPFTAAKNLYLCQDFARRIGPALLELVEPVDGRTPEALLALENVYLEGLESSGSVEKGIGRFVAAREVAGHPITISGWTNSEKEKFPPYYA